MATRQLRLYVYYFVIFLLGLGAFYSFYRITRQQPADYLYVEKCLLCALSSFFNLFVLYYHFTHAPHPKYVILLQRRLVIYTHIISGGLEFVSCWTAYLTGSDRIATIAALVAILGHVPSAYYQTSISFGAKALTVPGYLFTISLHLFCALNLFMTPSSTYWLLNMFLVHNIYVWCRVFYFFFSSVGIFKDSLYTNTILTSCLLLFPAVLGVSANVVFLGYVASAILLYFMIVQPNKEEHARFLNEGTRDLLINQDVLDAWKRHKARLLNKTDEDNLTDQEHAKQVFDQLDSNKNGTLDGEEIIHLLAEWQTAPSFMKRFEHWSKKGDITFEVFYRKIWRLGETSKNRIEGGRQRRDIVKARFVFDYLDSDSSGYIDTIELQKLLIQWGLPDNEVDAYLAYDDDKRFSFEEFFQHMKPIWNFAYENMISRDVGQMIGPVDHTD